MRIAFTAALVALFLICSEMAVNVPEASAHQSGCHAAHSCPSDQNTYTCGDTGNYSQCPDLVVTPSVSSTSPAPEATVTARFGVNVYAQATYQWYRDGVALPDETAPTYVVTSDDVGHQLYVTAVVVDGRGQTVTASSPTVVPAIPPVVVIPPPVVVPPPVAPPVAPPVITPVVLPPVVHLVAPALAAVPPAAVPAIVPPAVAPTLTALTVQAPRVAKAGHIIVLAGVLKSANGASGSKVVVKLSKRVGARWILVRQIVAKTSEAGAYKAQFKLPRNARGKWKAQASFAGNAALLPSVSTVRTLTVKQ